MIYQIEITDDVVGEIGEAIAHEDHSLTAESYHFNRGDILTVASYNTTDPFWHIFTDLDSGHRFKIHPNQYVKLEEEERRMA